MKTKHQILYAAIMGFTTFFNLNAHAEDTNPKLKSVGTAVALSLDPIPGDALFYAGKPGQGMASLLIGALGGYLFFDGLLDNSLCGGEYNKPCGPLGPSGYRAALGAFLYFPALVWDGIGGISGVKSYNEKIKNRRASIWKTVQPTVAVTNEGFFVGGQFRF